MTKQIGDVRVSTLLQNTARQLDGLPLDRIFEEKASGKDIKRPHLVECLAYLREGDRGHQPRNATRLVNAAQLGQGGFHERRSHLPGCWVAFLHAHLQKAYWVGF